MKPRVNLPSYENIFPDEYPSGLRLLHAGLADWWCCGLCTITWRHVWVSKVTFVHLAALMLLCDECQSKQYIDISKALERNRGPRFYP